VTRCWLCKKPIAKDQVLVREPMHTASGVGPVVNLHSDCVPRQAEAGSVHP
jgi:hypothetical protein